MLYPSEDSSTFLIKLSSCTLVHLFQKNEDVLLHKNLYMNVPNNFIFNSLMWEAMTVFSCGWMFKLWYICTIGYCLTIKGTSYWYMQQCGKISREFCWVRTGKNSPQRGQRMKWEGYKKATSGILGVTALIEMFGILTASGYMNLHVRWNFIEINTNTHIHACLTCETGKSKNSRLYQCEWISWLGCCTIVS